MSNLIKCASWLIGFGVFVLDYAHCRTGLHLDGTKSKCVQLGDTYCKGVPYNQTTFPNVLEHIDIQEARSAFNDFNPLIDIDCSDSLEQFLCFIYFPPCTAMEGPLRVCRSYCEEAVTSKCRDILKQFGKRPVILECDQYPVSDSTICIQPDNTISKNGGKVETATSGLNIPTGNGYYTSDEDTLFESTEISIDLELFLLVTNGNNIQLLDISSPNNLDTITLFRRLPALMSTTIDYYEPKHYIYWASNTEGKIFRGTLVLDSLRDIRPLIDTGSASVESIAVDWNLCVLFWTESVPVARLRTSSLSGRRVTTLLERDMKYPISLTLDPTEGMIFWIDRRGLVFDQSSSLECYSIVTERHSTIFNITTLTVVNGGRPTALVADILEKRLYFVDARSQSIHSIDYDGSDHKVLLTDHQLLREPDSLALHKGHILWTDKISRAIIWVDKKTGEDEAIIKTFDTGPPQNIKIYGAKDKTISTSLYDKSSLTEKWQELSSKENMEDYDADDDGYYDYTDEYEDDGDRRSQKNRKPKSSAKILSPNSVYTLMFLLYLFVNIR